MKQQHPNNSHPAQPVQRTNTPTRINAHTTNGADPKSRFHPTIVPVLSQLDWDTMGNEILQRASLATPMAIRVAVTLNIPARLTSNPTTATDLAQELNQNPTALTILLNHLTTQGFLERTPTGYQTTEQGQALDTPMADLLLSLDTAAGRAELAFVELAHSIATGEPAYPRRYGRDFWQDLADHPLLSTSFDHQMTERFHNDIPQMVENYDWHRFTTIADIGGGEGTLLAAILAAHPHTRGHLVDLPPTAARARATFADHGLTDRTQVTGGSFFDPLPKNADAYILFDILHDWTDDQAARILANCAEAARPHGRVLIIEAVAGLRETSDSDLAMLAIYGGRERTLDEFRKFAEPHGLVLDTVSQLTDERSLLDLRVHR